MRKTVSIVMLALLVTTTLAAALRIQNVKAELASVVTINADGSVSPPTAPISTLDNVTYVFVDDISEGITVQRSNIVIDGNGHTLDNINTSDYGFNLTNVDNVTISNTTIQGHDGGMTGILAIDTNDSQIVNNNIVDNNLCGISLTSCFGNNVSGNIGTSDNGFGIALYNSCNNILSNNHFDRGGYGAADGAFLYFSNNNTLSGNYVSGYAQFYRLGEYATNSSITGGFELLSSDSNKVIDNDVTRNGQGISLESSHNNILIANNVTGSHGYAGGGQIEPPWGFGIRIDSSSNNAIYHNNFIGNDVYELYENITVENNVMSDGSPNTWDDAYPSDGNFWSDYNGTDLYSGPYQNVTGSDGICDTPYLIDANNTDHYPLMGVFSDFSVAGGVDVQVVSNSTVSDFQFNGTALLFNVSAGNGNATFCKLCVPAALSNGTPTIFVNRTQVQYKQLTGLNGSVSYLYFTYGHSTVPEFPDPLILTILMVATLLAIVIHKKKYSSSIKGHA